MVVDMPEKALERVREQIPLGRLGKPEDIARVVGFLAADGQQTLAFGCTPPSDTIATL
jgi:NAD(P)-dependent dehydrogenase (short-subunit alcohol dehydrogenase family)